MYNKKACAVIAAAGSGNRMGGVSKPNIKILGKTLFEYVLEAFDGSGVCEITVVCSEDNEESLRAIAKGFKKPISFTRGGATRAESVMNGINATSRDCELVCVHDCARPFVTVDMIDATLSEAEKHGAACVCSSVTDTVKHKDPLTGFVSTPERNELFAVQTPQCFNKSLYLHAANAVGGDISCFTDETSLLEEIGVSVCYIKRTETNMKLTAPDDVPIAEILMKRKEVPV
jgi:2-C-methyl-D-erythritol 4-phosphate cytidylyltransferase